MEDDNEDVILNGDDEYTEEDDTSTSEEDQDSEQSQDGDETESEDSQDEGEDKEITDRGTKVAKEPDSRFYQSLKNQNADMRRLLGDPNAIKEYLRLMEGSQTPKEGEKDDFSDLEEQVLIDTPDGQKQVDLVKLAQYMDARMVKKIDDGIKFGVENRIQKERIGNRYNNDLSSIRKEHPELDPENKQFNRELDQLVGERFIAQGGMQGNVNLEQVIVQTYQDLEVFARKGRQQANTEIVRRRAGAIPLNRHAAEGGKGEDEDADPSTILASRVRKQVSGR